MTDQPSGPPTAPTAADRQALHDFDELVAESARVAQSSARTWASGVAVFVGLFSSVLLVSGPDKAADIAVAWRVPLVVALVCGLGCALGSLWLFFTADAGVPKKLSFEQFKQDYQGSREVYTVAAAKKAGSMIAGGRRLLLVALVMLSLASVVWLMAVAPPSSSSVVTVETRTGATYCGVLKDGDAAGISLDVIGASAPLRFRYSTIERIVAMTAC